MSEVASRTDADEPSGYGAADASDMEDAPEQDQPQTREPASEEEAGQHNYANTDEAS